MDSSGKQHPPGYPEAAGCSARRAFPAETSAGVRATASVVYRKVYYRIKCPAYQFDRGFLSEQGEAAFKEESRSLFQRDGWELLPERSSGASDTFTRGKERLYLHPMSYSGEVLEENISAVERLLASAKTFSCYATDLYESYLDLSPQSLRESLEAQREEIAADLLEAFRTPQRNQYHYDGKPLRQMIKKYGVLLIDERDLTGKTAGNVVSGIFFDLVKRKKFSQKTAATSRIPNSYAKGSMQNGVQKDSINPYFLR